ncbi:type VI secretion system TssO [Labilibaculum sp. K2S]|uniref:type VI secretion system TssO n=1 Tax=Labilibaculum sp. K2S TaxID=3056386 RepID=UPI0025A499F3|nr:type VI secretion system TssO [Labilibaculum sp. K2S]MDM8162088.1 type VI secretion system TssO [Labilibaculum sp. K2S]
MKSLNVKQRRKAFISFFFLFLLTTSLVVVIVFFNLKVPEKENKYLHNRLNYLNLEKKQISDFALKMDKVKALIDMIKVKGTNIEFTDQLISTELAVMRNKFIAEDSVSNVGMYNNIILTYLELKEAKIELLNLEDAKTDIESYVSIIEELKEKLEAKQRDLDIYRHNAK